MKIRRSWWILVIVAGLITYVWISTQCVSTGIEITKLKARRAELLNLNRITGVEISGLRSAERVEKIARNELGFVLPEKYENITVPENVEKDKSALSGVKDWFAKTIGYVF